MKRSKLLGFVAAIVISLLVIAIPAKPVQAQATVIVFPTTGAVGTMVSITGTGFTAGQTYSITFGYVPTV